MLLLSATWAMGGFVIASTVLEPLLTAPEDAHASSLKRPPEAGGHADEQARLVLIREAIAAFAESTGRYPANLDELVTGRWLAPDRLEAPARTGTPFYGTTSHGYTLLPWRH